MDVVDKATRSRMMSGIRGKDTKPEKVVRRCLTSRGFRYRLHRRDLPGAPDIVMPGRRAAVFVHGCFWHQHAGCRYATRPSSNAAFWQQKLDRNVERDKAAVTALRAAGWRVLTVWECATRRISDLDELEARLAEWVDDGDCLAEIPDLADQLPRAVSATQRG